MRKITAQRMHATGEHEFEAGAPDGKNQAAGRSPPRLIGSGNNPQLQSYYGVTFRINFERKRERGGGEDPT